MAGYLFLDGNSLVYRAFFALPTDMATASGQVTNAVFGFTSMLVNLLRDQRPDGVVVAFDRPEPTFRHEMVVDYKAGRAETPDILRQQMGLVRQVLEALRIPVLDAPGYEADDIVATLATWARDRGDDAVIVTGDRDTFQLVEDPHIRVLYNRRGVSDYVLYDEAGITDRTGVAPRSYVEYAALRGDQSDNLPGVPGVGEKTAARLVRSYGDLDGIFAHLEEASPKLRQSLSEHEAQVRKNASVIPLDREAPVECDLDRLSVGGWDPESVHRLFSFLEFRTLWDRLVDELGADGLGASGPASVSREGVRLEQVETARPAHPADAVKALKALHGSPSVAVEVAWEGAPGRSAPLGMALVTGMPDVPPATELEGTDGGLGPGSGAHALWIRGEHLADPDVRRSLEGLLTGDRSRLTAHRSKELMRGLALDVTTLDVDTAVAAYLLDPAESHYLLEDLSSRYANLDVGGADGQPAGQLDLDPLAADPAEEAARRALAISVVAPALRQALEAQHLDALYDEVERPLVRVLARMELAGIRVDVPYLRGLIDSLSDEVERLEKEIQELAGEPFRVNSTPQLRTILFDKLGLTPQKRTKTGYSTDAASLERLRGEHPIVEALLRYREVEKLRSTYGEGLLSEVAADGRIHASFNQTVARTGRLSSDQPNLHNIPVRSEEGRRFRRAFVPADGHTFLVADYNQIELRVIAHLAEDPGLVEAFAAGEDIHRTTAARVFEVDPAQVTVAQRSKAKMVSYGLAYGMEAYGLSSRLNIPVDEASQILDAYFGAFPRVRDYMDETVADARAKGYTETLFGRRRRIPELASSNFRIRQAGERQAMNAGIQGLAADVFKVALVRLDQRLQAEGLGSRLVLQVHDEVILEVPPSEREEVTELVREVLTGACALRVPLEVDVTCGETWADAKG